MTDAQRPRLMLLPGLDGTGDLFARLRPHLEPALDVQIVRYPKDPAMHLADYVSFVLSQMPDKPVFVLGESFSGPVSVCVAAARPEQVSGLILAATFLQSPWPTWLVRLAAAANPHLASIRARDAVLMGGGGDGALSRAVSTIVADMPPGVRRRRLLEVAAADTLAIFRTLSCPVMALHGANDWLVWKGPMQRAINGQPKAKLVTLDGPHMLLQRASQSAAREIIAFCHQCGQVKT